MYLTRWQRPETTLWPAFDRLWSLHDEIERLFESPLGEWARVSQPLAGLAPAVDLYEDANSFIIRAELPGISKEAIDVSLHEGALTISGERKQEGKFADAQNHRQERFFGRFHRTIALPKAVQGDKVTAEYKDGILTVVLPKTEEVKPRQIAVSVK